LSILRDRPRVFGFFEPMSSVTIGGSSATREKLLESDETYRMVSAFTST